MQSFSWAPEHSTALREFIARGMSYADAADALNARFGTAYTRSAAIGRGKRMGLAVPGRPEDRRAPAPKAPKRSRMLARKTPGPSTSGNTVSETKPSGNAANVAHIHGAGIAGPSTWVNRAEPVKLRCVGIQPRLLALVELEDGDCRYPYGGDKDGEAIAFCAHPRLRGSPYCAPHFHLTRAPAVDAERPLGPFVLRLVEAA